MTTSPNGSVVRSLRDERSFWRALVRVYGNVLQHLDQELSSTIGLPVMELEALYDLNEASGRRLQLNQLATRLGISRSGATRIVDRLQRAGLVERETSPSDKRVIHAILTPKGEETLGSAREVYEHILHYALVRHRSLEGLEVFTMTDQAADGNGLEPPSWYRVQFAPAANG